MNFGSTWGFRKLIQIVGVWHILLPCFSSSYVRDVGIITGGAESLAQSFVDSSVEASSLRLVDLYLLKWQFNYDVIFVMGSVL